MKAFEDSKYEQWKDHVEQILPSLLKRNLLIKPAHLHSSQTFHHQQLQYQQQQVQAISHIQQQHHAPAPAPEDAAPESGTGGYTASLTNTPQSTLPLASLYYCCYYYYYYCYCYCCYYYYYYYCYCCYYYYYYYCYYYYILLL